MGGKPLGFEKSEGLKALRAHFGAGKTVRFLVGAGPSIAAGLPNWNGLNLALLQEYLRERNPGLELSQEDLRRMAIPFVERFGRDAVVDLVRQELTTGRRKDKVFNAALCRALYQSRARYLPSAAHAEIAAFKDKKKTSFYTFNYDDLLETALGDATPYTSADEHPPEQRRVTHLHGLMKPDGKVRGSIVLSERDYHRTGDKSFAQRELDALLDGDGKVAVVLVGLSLADPRLRKALLDRLADKKRVTVYVIMVESGCPEDGELAERLAHGLIRRSEPTFWDESWDIKPILIPANDLIPFTLRKVRLGLQASEWIIAAQKRLDVEKRIFDPDVQSQARHALRELLQLIRLQFAVPTDEHLQIGAFLPRPTGKLGLAFAHHEAQDVKLTRALADERQLTVTTLGEAQGASGYAFLTGLVVDAEPGSPLLDRNFDEEMRRAWRSVDHWELDPTSLLSVPVFAADQATPLGVVYLASTRDAAFWRSLDARRHFDLYDRLRNAWEHLVKAPNWRPDDQEARVDAGREGAR